MEPSNPNINSNPSFTTESPVVTKGHSVIWRIFKILGIVLVTLVVLGVVASAVAYVKFKDAYITAFFGNKENYDKYVETENIYDQSYAGDYQKCNNLEPKEKQFCLWLAYENSTDTKICENMSPDLYPPDHMYSQESCFISIAVVKNDKTVCDRVTNKASCADLFAIVDAQREICGPLFKSDSNPVPADCYDYAVAQKTKAACDGLVAAGGQNWKEICDISAGLVSTSSLSVIPTKIGQCVMTKVAKVGNDIDGSSNVGSAIEYLNGVKQLSLEKIDQVDMAKTGDVVQLCLRALPNCTNWKYKGNVYEANNISGGFTWTLADSMEMCK